jgi:hypothetical protein
VSSHALDCDLFCDFISQTLYESSAECSQSLCNGDACLHYGHLGFLKLCITWECRGTSSWIVGRGDGGCGKGKSLRFICSKLYLFIYLFTYYSLKNCQHF